MHLYHWEQKLLPLVPLPSSEPTSLPLCPEAAGAARRLHSSASTKALKTALQEINVCDVMATVTAIRHPILIEQWTAFTDVNTDQLSQTTQRTKWAGHGKYKLAHLFVL